MRLDTEVLIVGAGPVGLALAADLGWRGRTCAVLEQGDGSIYQPKMDLVGVRTMEFCRRWGIVRDVEEAPYPRDYPQDNVYVTSLNGYELGRERFPSMDAEKPPAASPQKRERCPQNMFDPVLRKFAHSFSGVDWQYRHRLVSYVDQGDHVRAKVQNLATDEVQDVTARFLVGCDGAKSRVREGMGVEMEGNPSLTYTTNIIFRCPDLNALHPLDPGYRFIVVGPDGTWATLVAINGRDQWRMSIVGSATPRTYSEAEIADAIRKVVGRDFEFEVLTIVPWSRGELVAKRYAKGNVFIAGDACHVMSPTGGFGMNTGIADAVDLSWKLSAVLEGWGGPALLDSYDVERRPIGGRNVREASGNLNRMLSPGRNPALLEDSSEGAVLRAEIGESFSKAMRHEWYTTHIHLGFCYTNSPIIDEEGEPAWDEERGEGAFEYRQSARPGCRAPHAWLSDGRSTLDLFGRGFVLVATDPTHDTSSIISAARGAHVPLEVVVFEDDAIERVYGRTLTLVRPDGHVAWRSNTAPSDAAALIRLVTGNDAEQAQQGAA